MLLDQVEFSLLMNIMGKAGKKAIQSGDGERIAAITALGRRMETLAPWPFVDHKLGRPRLHDMHVVYAQQELEIIDRTIQELSDLSRVSPMIVAAALKDERTRLIMADAAYREAVWRRAAGSELQPREQHSNGGLSFIVDMPMPTPPPEDTACATKK